MAAVYSPPKLPSIESDMTEQFRRGLAVTEFRPVPWVEGIKTDLETASSISLTPGVDTVLAIMAVAEVTPGGATFAIPAINPLRSEVSPTMQVPHSTAFNRLRDDATHYIRNYLSLYIWKTVCHTDEQPDLIGLCYGHDFSPPYHNVRRLHLEEVVRRVPFLRLFSADYTFQHKPGSKICNLTEFK